MQSIVDINASDLVNDQIQMMNADGELIDAQIPTLTAEEIDTLYAIEGLKSFLPIFMVVVPFLFIGGFLLYAAFFATIGAASNPDSDAQQYILPITGPIFISVIIAMTIMENPESNLVFWSSIFPLTSPVVMTARLPFIDWSTEWWEVILSIILLFISVWLSISFAAKVYKTAILMYGQKLSYSNIWKWFKQSNR